MDRFTIGKPDLTGVDGSRLLWPMVSEEEEWENRRIAEHANYPEYLPWDRFKHRPTPEGIRIEEMWWLVKNIRRLSGRRQTSVVAESEENFSWYLVPRWEYTLHRLDMGLGGNLGVTAGMTGLDPSSFVSRGIMEEAIASSQLEGAVTTRRQAKRMIQERRKPRSTSEQMILNNYQAEQAVVETYSNRTLQTADILALHATLTADTVAAGDVGRLRRDSDDIVVADAGTGVIYHVPPSAGFVREELEHLLFFANGPWEAMEFVHPVIAAIMVHFWFGYLHPFTDGNGRLARLLFRWYLLRKGYWGITYLPLSRVIRNSPAQYRNAYIYAEQDDLDLNYFIDYNLRKLIQAKLEFDSYVERKLVENTRMQRVADSRYGLNTRQIQLLRYLYKNSQEYTRISTHATIYGVHRLTAQKDLRQLERLGFLKSTKVGREIRYAPTEKVSDLFR